MINGNQINGNQINGNQINDNQSNGNQSSVFSDITVPLKTLLVLFCFSSAFLAIGVFMTLEYSKIAKSSSCNNIINLPSVQSSSQASQSLSKTGSIPEGEIYCFLFSAVEGQRVSIEAGSKLNAPLELVSPTGSITPVQMGQPELLEEAGRYRFSARNGTTGTEPFELKFSFTQPSDASLSDFSPSDASLSDSSSEDGKLEKGKRTPDADATDSNRQEEVRSLTYNVKNAPELERSVQLDSLVNYASEIKATEKNLPIDKLSVILIDLNTRTFGAYQHQKPLFPASITKLFWLIALFEYEKEQIIDDEIPMTELYDMMQDSDNDPASRVVNILTNTKSGEALSAQALAQWKAKRETINTFYTAANYQNININQKNFPIPKEGFEDPTGSDKAIRGNESNPIRNALTAEAIARLLYEIETEQAVSPDYSRKAKNLMKRDFAKEAAKRYDSITGFLGKGLDPSEVSLHSKAGWTSDSRQDTAIVYSADSSVHYILVVMGEDKAYAKNEDYFPEVSEYIFKQMSAIARR